MKITLGFIFTLLALICCISNGIAASASIKKDLALKQYLAKEALREELENPDEENIEPENKLLQPINEEEEEELENENDFDNDDDIDDDLLLDDDAENALQEAESRNILNDMDDLDDDDDDDINELAEFEEGRARRHSGRDNKNRLRRGGSKNRKNRRARRNHKNRNGRRNRRYLKHRNRSG